MSHEQRRKSAAFAVANTTLAGGTVGSGTAELLERWSNGEISDIDLIHLVLEKNEAGNGDRTGTGSREPSENEGE